MGNWLAEIAQRSSSPHSWRWLFRFLRAVSRTPPWRRHRRSHGGFAKRPSGRDASTAKVGLSQSFRLELKPALCQTSNTTNHSYLSVASLCAAMSSRRHTPISLRKQPQQARSSDLVATILDAAAQVLAEEGAPRFTSARVAEKAGVSVGSLYQYFPNKAAILFRLQTEEWTRTIDLLRGILEDIEKPPLERLRQLAHAFIRSECDEAKMRVALNDAAPLYRDAPEAQAARAAGHSIVQGFMREALPKASESTRELAGDLITMTLSQVGKRFSETPRTAAETKAFAGAVADMFCAYLDDLEHE